ncbi:MAG: ABC transporter ATP-binding protein [Vigna little leaf phytoplasma]|nr:ABC transporter ATP-binding protein [Vigna little leaf phytoplasma]
MKKLKHYLKPFLGRILTSFILIFFLALINAFIPLFEGKYIISFINKNFDNNDKNLKDYMFHMYFFLSINLLLYIFCTMGKFIYNRFLITAIHSVIKNIRQDMQKKIHKLPIQYFDQNTVGNIMSRMTNDMDVVSNGLQQSCATLITSIFNILMLVILMFWTNLRLGIVVCSMIPMSLLTIFIINHKSRNIFIQRFEKSGEYNGFLQEKYMGHQEIILYNQQDNMIKEFQILNRDFSNIIFKSNFLSGLVVPIVNSFTYIILSVMILLGFFLTHPEIAMPVLLSRLGFVVIEVGVFQAFIQYIWRLGNPINDLSQIFVILQSTKAAFIRIFTFLNESEETESSENIILNDVEGKINFINVTFGYYKHQPIIKNMNLQVLPKQTVAIVGSTGSGKTTLINLLTRFYDIQEGMITIDGVDICKIKKTNLRKILGIVFQDIWLFHGTILDNLRYGSFHKTKEQVIAAAKQTKIHDFIMAKKDNYQTIIGEELDNLSQGEKQLISITRTLLYEPNILILDEATSTIDTQIEAILQKSIQKILQKTTSFVIAHRLSTIVNADMIIVLKNGIIVEQGKHQNLLEKKGFYYNLYISQFQNS